MNVYVVVTKEKDIIGVSSVNETVLDALQDIYNKVNENYEYNLYSLEDVENEIDKYGYVFSKDVQYFIRKSEI